MKAFRRIVALSFFLSLLFFATTISFASPVYYQVIDLGVGKAYDINNQGQVLINSGNQAYIWEESTGAVSIVGMSGGQAINNLGHVVGRNASGDCVLWTSGGGLETFVARTSSYPYSIPRDINDQGQIVGITFSSTGVTNAFFWSETTGMIDIGGKSAAAINNSGMVVGSSNLLWTESGGTQSLGIIGDYVVAYGENDLGQVVGSIENQGAPRIGFFWDEGTYTEIGRNIPHGINNLGQVVGTDFGGDPFLWTEEGGVQILDNSLVWGDLSWRTLRPLEINDDGIIVGFAEDAVSNEDHAFVMIPTDIAPPPVPIPGAVWLLGSGFLALAGLRKKLSR